MLCAAASRIVPAADPPAPTEAEQIEAAEAVRAKVDALFERYQGPVARGERLDLANRTAEAFAALGADAVPYLVSELEGERQETFDLCSYTLGLIDHPEAEQALRETIARAEQVEGSAALTRKAWAAWGLALQGHADVIPLLIEGRHRIADYPIYAGTTLLEIAALQTAPQSVPVLLELLPKLATDPERWQARRATMRALRWLADPRAVPPLVALLGHEAPQTRREAANSLRTLRTPESIAALVGALSDADPTVRRAAALSLEYQGAPLDRTVLVGRLENETDGYTRGVLYRLVVGAAGAEALDLLAGSSGRGDPLERRAYVTALAQSGDPRRVRALIAALDDADNGVVLEAVLSLGRIGDGPASEALLETLGRARLPVLPALAEQLARLGARKAGPVLTHRLTSEILREPLTDADPSLFAVFEPLARALVELGHVAGIEELERAAARQTDAGVRGVVERTVVALQRLRKNGRSLERWTETASEDQVGLRALAYEQLADIGGAEAARVLVGRFDAASRDERLLILEALGRLPGEQTRALLERVLLDPSFDAPAERALRETAGFSARRLGGDEMARLLERAVERRDGLEARLVVYAALLSERRMLPVLERIRRPRLRHLGWHLLNEQDRLDWLAARLRDGRSIAEVDLPPDKLLFN